MSSISNPVGNSSTNRLAQQVARAASTQVLNKNQSLPVSDSSVASKPDILNSQLTSSMNKWSDAKQAIDKLGNAPQEINQSRKAFAAEVLKRIKEQIRIMMMLTAGDPKARARQIASLARELAAAAQEYASASGGSSQISEASIAGSASVQNEITSSGEQSNSASAVANAAGAANSATEVTAQPDQNVGTAVALMLPRQQLQAQQNRCSTSRLQRIRYTNSLRTNYRHIARHLPLPKKTRSLQWR